MRRRFFTSRVTKGLLSNVQRDYEKSGSHTFVARKVYNCYVVGVRPIQATVTEGDKSQSLSLGHPIICSVCGNEVGFKKGNLYYLMNMIEEDGDIDSTLCNKHSLKDYTSTVFFSSHSFAISRRMNELFEKIPICLYSSTWTVLRSQYKQCTYSAELSTATHSARPLQKCMT